MKLPRLNQPILAIARTDFARLGPDMTVTEALESIRQQGLGERIIYFYVLDDQQRLVGIVPTRRLLMSAPERLIGELMIRNVIAIPDSATVLEACEFFVMHKFFAFPVVDEHRHLVGIVDVSLFAGEVLDLAEGDQRNSVFEAIGFRVAQVRDASPFKAFRFRFPWLLATISSGTLCAMLAGGFEHTLARLPVLAFFLTMVLGLAESVAMQSMTVTIQALRSMPPTWRWYRRALRREIAAALLLGGACGASVTGIAWLWRGDLASSAVIGAGIACSLCTACVFGLTIPTLLHAMRLDPKIAAGPITLACTDTCALIFYFGLAAGAM